ncbi:MAG: type III-B CRISPR module RAMP protein Cmr6 [Planctomycetaceae bacterium]|nr:type III-B CRISPR module RAMP protein Cmr6 [Planctomycetaceae bacterium]
MTTARRSALPNSLNAASHAGLLLDCYLSQHPQDEEQSGDAKKSLLDAAKKAIASGSSKDAYQAAFDRWKNSLPDESRCVFYRLQTTTRLIVGLGGTNVTETGMTLHHTYGVPFIPGTALKAISARYARQVWGATNDTWKGGMVRGEAVGEHYGAMFGMSDAGGLVTFLDAWIAPSAAKDCIVLDVMTPHHGEYYGGRARNPTDFDRPIPVPWVSVKGAFNAAIIVNDSRLPKSWLDTAGILLTSALREYGVGAKTNAGYGRLSAEPQSIHVAEADQSAESTVVLVANRKYEAELTEPPKPGKDTWKVDIVFEGSRFSGVLLKAAGLKNRKGKKAQVGNRIDVVVTNPADPTNVQCRLPS